MEKRYFVTIIARDRELFLVLHDYELDLAHGSARARDREQPSIEGLLTLEEVARARRGRVPVVAGGLPVPSSKSSAARLTSLGDGHQLIRAEPKENA